MTEFLLDKLSEEDFDNLLEARKKKNKKIRKQYFYLFAPFYGIKGNSAAEINTGNTGGDASSPAYPGNGGINTSGVPAGPNSGMGPNI